MRGVKYNLKFREIDNTERIYKNLLIKDCVDKLKHALKQSYNLDIDVSKHIIYNLVHRPTKSNKVIRELCKVEFSNRSIPELTL